MRKLWCAGLFFAGILFVTVVGMEKLAFAETLFIGDVEKIKEGKKIAPLLDDLCQDKKPWKRTNVSVAFCDKVSAQACLRGFKEVFIKVVDADFGRYEYTTVTCEKGFFPNRICRTGYSVSKTGGMVNENLSCSRYVNGKCMGKYHFVQRETETRCIPQPTTKLDIWQEADGRWKYTESFEGCSAGNYKIVCNKLNPATLVCEEGFYEELGECSTSSRMVISGDSHDFAAGCVPYEDKYSCSIKNGKCINKKVSKGEHHAAPLKHMQNQFRLKLPANYAFE